MHTVVHDIMLFSSDCLLTTKFCSLSFAPGKSKKAVCKGSCRKPPLICRVKLLLAACCRFHLIKNAVNAQRTTCCWWKLFKSLKKLSHVCLCRYKHPHLVSIELADIQCGIRANLEATYPLGLGEPSDAAAACSFLISDQARWITGQVLFVDGGRTAQMSNKF